MLLLLDAICDELEGLIILFEGFIMLVAVRRFEGNLLRIEFGGGYIRVSSYLLFYMFSKSRCRLNRYYRLILLWEPVLNFI